MLVHTRRLFINLLPVLKVNAVCDVGSMNGKDALAFRRAVPRARIYAFEPNPENFRLMQVDPRFREQDIHVTPFAATNYDGDGDFFVVKADFPTQAWRGMSSLYERAGRTDLSSETVPVKTIRLDSFLAREAGPDLRLALWIDAEGKAFEVIEGATGLARSIVLLHVEVETTPCISAHQRLYPEVKGLLDSLGFIQLGTDAPPTQTQFNAVFIRNDLPDVQRRYVRWWLGLARARRAITPLVLKFIPRWLLQLRNARC